MLRERRWGEIFISSPRRKHYPVGIASSEGDSNTDDAYLSVPASSSSSSSGEEDDPAVEVEQQRVEELVGQWMSRDGKMTWFPTSNETLRYNPVPTGTTTGPTIYVVAHINDLRSAFDLFITDEIIQLLCTHTNMHGRQRCEDWRDVDAVEMRAYIRTLLLAGV